MFTVACGDQLVWDNKRDGGFPDVRVLKQRIRDLVEPERSLGHTDRVGVQD
ncbi:MAG: Rdx family protein [Dehalococcoidia bacterium]